MPKTSNKIKRILIANRGEISARIASTAQRMGIETVAITDQTPPPAYLTQLITEFITVAEEDTALYLNGEAIINLAKKHNCDAIHPGFGFLSESAIFAANVVKAGLIWIGPSPVAIEKMASKATAREIAVAAKIPCIDGIQNFNVPESSDGDFNDLEAFAESKGYPLLIKAALGGGGKGMRLVEDKSQLRESALRARSEAINSFGDGNLICEQYIQSPRHIEVQILADNHGRVVAIGDRDCSVQRRHQKILEEAPAIGLTAATRKKLHQCAIALAEKVNYSSTGTVEFLLDWPDQAKKNSQEQKFYFLEMNTRLQVEHPVSEEVFGLDLVEWQFRVANGETLDADFSKLTPRGHSIEARIYSEDTDNDFFPAPGGVYGFLPAYGPGVRWEVGIDTIDHISGKFDPMVAKVIATGATRDIAVSRLSQALKGTFFASPASNQEFLLDICTSSDFATQAVSTNFIKESFTALKKTMEDQRAILQVNTAEILSQVQKSRGRLHGSEEGLNSAVSANALTTKAFNSNLDIKPRKSKTSKIIAGLQMNFMDQKKSHVSLGQAEFHSTDQAPVSFYYSFAKTEDAEITNISIGGRLFRAIEETKASLEGSQSNSDSTDITAPVPGKVIKVMIEPNSKVKKGDTVFVLESMKMEFEVKTNRDGIIESLSAQTNQQVNTGEILAKWQEANE